MQFWPKVIARGEPRPFDRVRAERIYRDRPFRTFRPTTIDSSPFITNPRLPVTIKMLRPEELEQGDFAFTLGIGGERAGTWEIEVVPSAPEFWRESGATHHLHTYDFRIEKPFRSKETPGNWYAAAFRRAAHNLYLVNAYHGWILDGNTLSQAMNRVYEAAHGMAHLVQHAQHSWQPHAYLVPLDQSLVPTPRLSASS